jgi:hypothetical protein
MTHPCSKGLVVADREGTSSTTEGAAIRCSSTQLDALQHLARRLNAAALAIRALGTDAGHQAVEELITDVADDLSHEVAR